MITANCTRNPHASFRQSRAASSRTARLPPGLVQPERLPSVFEAPERCILLLVAEHTGTENPYQLIYWPVNGGQRPSAGHQRGWDLPLVLGGLCGRRSARAFRGPPRCLDPDDVGVAGVEREDLVPGSSGSVRLSGQTDLPHP
jgi:hypothetical protein